MCMNPANLSAPDAQLCVKKSFSFHVLEQLKISESKLLQLSIKSRQTTFKNVFPNFLWKKVSLWIKSDNQL